MVENHNNRQYLASASICIWLRAVPYSYFGHRETNGLAFLSAWRDRVRQARTLKAATLRADLFGARVRSRRTARLWIVSSLFICNACLPCAHADGSVEGSVVIEHMKPATGPGYRVQTKNPVQPPDPETAIVFLETDDGRYPGVRADQVIRISQKGYQFRPAVIAVQTGSRVVFPNQDDEFHNVFSYSRAKRFDLGRFRKDEKSPVLTFDKPGLVKVYCEIHKHMRNLLLVLDTPWFTTSDERGRFVLNNVPAGNYLLKAFLPSERVLQVRVSITDGKTTVANLTR